MAPVNRARTDFDNTLVNVRRNRLKCSCSYILPEIFRADGNYKMHVAIYDVFAEQPYGGNQAAVVRANEIRFSDSQLVALAAELTFPETALLSMRGSNLVFRFATAGRVISRCGHATLAGVADHMFSTVLPHRTQAREWRGHYRVGSSVAEWCARTAVRRRARNRGAGIEVAVAWPDRPEFMKALPARAVYRALRLDTSAASPELPLCIYNSGNLNALVPVRTVAALERADPDWAKLRSLFEKFCLTDLHLYCLQRRRPASDQLRLRCRNFFPYGVFEETATGTASVALAAALTDHLPALQGRTRAIDFVFDQGKGKRRGKILVRWRPRVDDRVMIWLEGRVFRIVYGQLISIPPC